MVFYRKTIPWGGRAAEGGGPYTVFYPEMAVYGVLSKDESVGAAPLGGLSSGTSGAIGKPFLNFLQRLF